MPDPPRVEDLERRKKYPYQRVWGSDWRGSRFVHRLSDTEARMFFELILVIEEDGHAPASAETLIGEGVFTSRFEPAVVTEFLRKLLEAGKILETDRGTLTTPRIVKAALQAQKGRSSVSVRTGSGFEPPARAASSISSTSTRTRNQAGEETRAGARASRRGRSATPPRRGRVELGGEEDLPEALRSPEFLELWRLWEGHRREIKKPLTPTSLSQQLSRLAGWGPRRARAAIEHTIAQGWQGLREPEPGQNTAMGESVADRMARIRREDEAKEA